MLKLWLNLLLITGCATSQVSPVTTSSPMQSTPQSAKETQPKAPTVIGETEIKRHGNIVEVSCTGTSITQGFAREAALTDCKKSVSSLLDSTIKVNTKVWDTNDNAYLHKETDSLTTYEGLDCQPLKETSEEMINQFRVNLTCRFDISRAKAIENKPTDLTRQIEVSEFKTNIKAENQMVNLASFPQCDKIFTGKKEIKCTNKTMLFGVDKTLQEIIVEKKGYMPYRVKLNGTSQTLMIYLTPSL